MRRSGVRSSCRPPSKSLGNLANPHNPPTGSPLTGGPRRVPPHTKSHAIPPIRVCATHAVRTAPADSTAHGRLLPVLRREGACPTCQRESLEGDTEYREEGAIGPREGQPAAGAAVAEPLMADALGIVAGAVGTDHGYPIAMPERLPDGRLLRVDGEIVTQAQYDAEYRLLLGIAALLNTPAPLTPPYISTHGPWNMQTMRCERCQESDIAIHDLRLTCHG
jgi:hypothetical protein